VNAIFTIELLPARHGDAIWIEYGDPAAPHRILIDGGARKATRDTISDLIAQRIDPAASPDFELIVLTHIDADHITGLLNLLEDRSVPLRPRDVWFNGWEHMPDDLLGAEQAERLSKAIRERGLPWNAAFAGHAVRLDGTYDDPYLAPLPAITLPGGMRLTLLSPTYKTLADLKPKWKEEVEAAGLVPGGGPPPERPDDLLGGAAKPLDPDTDAMERFSPDPSKANAGSIAFLAEFEGRSALLTGDAHAPVLEASIGVLLGSRQMEKLAVDVFKVPHHGSKYNLSPGLLKLVDTRRYLFSTDGSSRSHHPDRVAVSRIVTMKRGASLEFNYETDYSRPWADRRLRNRYGYDVVVPGPQERWLTIRLDPEANPDSSSD